MKTFTVGFVGFGEVNSPRDIIERKCAAAQRIIEGLGADVRATAPVSDDPADADARRALADLNRAPLDALIVCIAGWIPTHAVLKVVDEFRHLPILLWGLAGYYENGRLVTTADQAGTTALRQVLTELGYNFIYLFERPGAQPRVSELRDFLAAARTLRALRRSRVGMMGYRDMKLYATLHDGVTLKRALGVEVECFEMLEMVQRAESIAPAEVAAVIARLEARCQFQRPADPRTLEMSARYFLALKGLIAERGYDSVSLIDVDGMKKLLQLPPALIFMLIADELGLPTIPENDALGSVTQLLVKEITGQSAAYFEFYEFMEDRVLMGVPDYVPAAIVAGPVRLLPTRFGQLSEGVLNVSTVKTGRVTLVRLLANRQGYALHVVTGEAVAPRSWEEAGWAPPAPQLPSLEVILDVPVESFAEEVAGQHYILVYGDVTKTLKNFCRLAGMTMIGAA